MNKTLKIKHTSKIQIYKQLLKKVYVNNLVNNLRNQTINNNIINNNMTNNNNSKNSNSLVRV